MHSLTILRSFAGYRFGELPADLVAGLTLAAIAVPEQMATAHLGGLSPETGFLALIAGAIGFALFGASRVMSIGADSTIAPIFAGSLALLAAAGSHDYATSAAALAIGVGLALTLAGVFRLGFVADLLSIPVTTGFLAGIAAHIVVSQAPAIMGIPAPPGDMITKTIVLATGAGGSNLWTLAIGFGVLLAMLAGEAINPRLPAALSALAIATGLTAWFGLDAHGVETLGTLPGLSLKLNLPFVSFAVFRDLAPLALIVSIVVMVQTAATTRSFVADPSVGPDVNRDFIGVGAANLLAGLTGAFPVNASPPRTAVIKETGGVSQLGALVCAGLALGLALYGGAILAHLPHAALAGVLLFVAQRIVRVGVMADVVRRSLAEFGLIVVTALALIVLPIQQGVGVGIMLSILHGVWTTTRAQIVEFERIPGTSIWWPKTGATPGETVPGVRVLALQAPLSFLNAYRFQQALRSLPSVGLRLIVIEANAIVEIDYTAGKILGEQIRTLKTAGVDIAVARLEALRAQQSFARQGLESLIGKDHLFHSVEEAIEALGPARPA